MAVDRSFAAAAGLPPVPDVRPPSTPKAMIDAALREWTNFTILDADRVRDLLLDLRAEV